MVKIKDLPSFKRPREKLIEKGVQNLKDEELLAILLRTGREEKVVRGLLREKIAIIWRFFYKNEEGVAKKSQICIMQI